MPQNAEYLMAVELKNIALSWFEMCALSGKYDEQAMRGELARVCALPEIREAVQQKDFAVKEPEGIRGAIQESNVKYIEDFLAERITAGKYRRFIKRILK